MEWREGREAEREQKSHPEGENEYKSDGSKSGFSREVKMRWPAVWDAQKGWAGQRLRKAIALADGLSLVTFRRVASGAVGMEDREGRSEEV